MEFLASTLNDIRQARILCWNYCITFLKCPTFSFRKKFSVVNSMKSKNHICDLKTYCIGFDMCFGQITQKQILGIGIFLTTVNGDVGSRMELLSNFLSRYRFLLHWANRQPSELTNKYFTACEAITLIDKSTCPSIVQELIFGLITFVTILVKVLKED